VTRTSCVEALEEDAFVGELQKTGAGTLFMALDGGRRGDDYGGAIVLFARGDRLANAAENMASEGGWVICG
jgi:hypothetical protein